MLIIRHKSGPLAGKDQQIAPTSDRIIFGRDASVCDVVFPMEETTVSRRHFALVRKPSGDWTFDLFGDPYVAANGVPVDAGQGVPSGTTIELGRPGGPSFEIFLLGEDVEATGPATQPQYKPEGARAAAASARKAASRAGRFGLIGLAVAVVAIGGAGALWQFYRSDTARLNTAMDTLNREQARITSESISPSICDRALQAAYFVVTRNEQGTGESYGTAAPIADDLLATNAHVAESFLSKGPKGRMFVRSPGAGGKEYEVVEVRIHPGYNAFQAFLRQDPFFVGNWRLTGAQVPSYDVALLRVAPGTKLGPVLEIASREDLANLKPGYPLVRAGYPTESVIGSEIQSQAAATPNLATGMISGMTDMFRLPGDPDHRRLIHHSVPSAGGASGSPLVGPSGKIVALNNAGSYVFVPKEVTQTQRISSSVLINYGQRADWLLDLMQNRADAAIEADRKYWEKQTAAFKRGIEVIVPAVLAEIKPPTGGTSNLKTREKATLTAADRYEAPARLNQPAATKRQKVHSVKLSAGKPNTFIAYAENVTLVQIYLVVDGKIVTQDERQTFFPHVAFTPTQDANAQVYVTGPDQDVNYTFFHYDWDAPRS